MNFQTLKWMLESLVKTFKCPECFMEIKDINVDIIGAAWNTINIDVECPKCKKHSMIKSEVLLMDLKKVNIVKNKLEEIKWKLEWFRITSEESRYQIKDEEIINLNETLRKEHLQVEDLFGDNNK